MDIIESIERRRSIRKFEKRDIDTAILEKLVSLASLHASAVNQQPLRFAVLYSQKRDKAHSCFRWAAAIRGYKINDEERPAAYIIILSEKIGDVYLGVEAGAAATNIMLASLEYGISTCCLGVADQEKLMKIMSVPDKYKIICAVALGYPAQKSEIVPYRGNHLYCQNSDGSISVPKEDYRDLIIDSDISLHR